MNKFEQAIEKKLNDDELNCKIVHSVIQTRIKRQVNKSFIYGFVLLIFGTSVFSGYQGYEKYQDKQFAKAVYRKFKDVNETKSQIIDYGWLASASVTYESSDRFFSDDSFVMRY